MTFRPSPSSRQPAPEAPSPSEAVGDNLIANAAGLLKKRGKKAVIILGGRSLSREGQMQAACIKAVCGCDLIAETFPARMERGVGLPRIDRIPYVPDLALNLLGSYEAVVLAGAPTPVTFFGYKDTPASLLGADQEVVALGEGPDALAELGRLAEALEAPLFAARRASDPRRRNPYCRQALSRATRFARCWRPCNPRAPWWWTKATPPACPTTISPRSRNRSRC